MEKEKYNPKKDDKFSPNLYKWLTYGNKYYKNIYFSPIDSIFYIGIMQNGFFGGSKLMAVFCFGNKAKKMSFAKSYSDQFIDYTDWFWSKYFQLGKQIYYSGGYWKIKSPIEIASAKPK